MSSELARKAESVLINGDLATLNEEERVTYYQRVCESVGLNPLTKPFSYLKLNGRLVLYALRDATDQLRKVNGVSIRIVAREKMDDIYVVTAQATDRSGRTDESTGVVPIGNLKGENLSNALMKAETKAKRRVTLSICGLGILDETEIESVHNAVPVPEESTKRLKEHVDEDLSAQLMATMIANAKTAAEVDELASKCQEFGFEGNDRAMLKEAFRVRRAELPERE